MVLLIFVQEADLLWKKSDEKRQQQQQQANDRIYRNKKICSLLGNCSLNDLTDYEKW